MACRDSNSDSHTCRANVLHTEPFPIPHTPLWTPTHRDESTLGVFAATVNSEHTLVVMQHVARFTDTALPAGGGGFMADAPTEAIWVRAGSQAGGKAVSVDSVGWALQSFRMERKWG